MSNDDLVITASALSVKAETDNAAVVEVNESLVITDESTPAEALTRLKTVDGSGSGLDADLLDGHEATYFEAAANKSTDGTLAANSDTLFPTQKAVKTYVAAHAGGGGGGGGGLADLVSDTTPQLGGELDTNGFDIALDDGHGLVSSVNGQPLLSVLHADIAEGESAASFRIRQGRVVNPGHHGTCVLETVASRASGMCFSNPNGAHDFNPNSQGDGGDSAPGQQSYVNIWLGEEVYGNYHDHSIAALSIGLQNGEGEEYAGINSNFDQGFSIYSTLADYSDNAPVQVSGSEIVLGAFSYDTGVIVKSLVITPVDEGETPASWVTIKAGKQGDNHDHNYPIIGAEGDSSIQSLAFGSQGGNYVFNPNTVFDGSNSQPGQSSHILLWVGDPEGNVFDDSVGTIEFYIQNGEGEEGASLACAFDFGFDIFCTVADYSDYAPIRLWGSSVQIMSELRLGPDDNDAPDPKKIVAQSVADGTSNTAGADLTIEASRGTGSQQGGAIVFRLAAKGSSGTSQNALADSLRLGFYPNTAIKAMWLGEDTPTTSNMLLHNNSGSICLNGSGSVCITANGGYGLFVSQTRVAMPAAFNFGWGPGGSHNDYPDTILGRAAAATLRLGDADAASPVAQTLSAQNVAAGTSNTAGADFSIAASKGTGTGVSGSINFQLAHSGSSGSAQNSRVTALKLFETDDGGKTGIGMHFPGANTNGKSWSWEMPNGSELTLCLRTDDMSSRTQQAFKAYMYGCLQSQWPHSIVGNFGLDATYTSMATTMNGPFIFIPGAAGPPTGTPNPSWMIHGTPLYYDTTNNKLYAYNGSWKASAAFT